MSEEFPTVEAGAIPMKPSKELYAMDGSKIKAINDYPPDHDMVVRYDENSVTDIELHGEEPLTFEPPLRITVCGMMPVGKHTKSVLEHYLRPMCGCSVEITEINMNGAHVETEVVDFKIRFDRKDSPHNNTDMFWDYNNGEFPVIVNGSREEDDSNDTCLQSDCHNPSLDHVSACEEHSELKDGEKKDITGCSCNDCIECNLGSSDDDGEEQDLESKLNEVADELGQKRVEEMDQRAVEYMRENRETFMAEITEVRETAHTHDDKISFILDIPTFGPWDKSFPIPNDRLNEIMDYLGVTLRELHMVEGMYLPMAYVDGDWVIQLPSDAQPFTESFWLKPRSFSLPSLTFGWIELPSMSNEALLCFYLIGIMVGISGIIVPSSLITLIGLGVMVMSFGWMVYK